MPLLLESEDTSLSYVSRSCCLWVRIWRCMLPFVVNVRWQYLHLKGRSPVWTSTCLSKDEADDSTWKRKLVL